VPLCEPREFAVNKYDAGYASTIIGWPYDWLLIRLQLPIGSNFIVAKYVQVPVTASDLEVAIVDAVPLIDVLGDVDLAAIETNSAELFGAILIHIGLRLDLHCVLLHHRGVPSPMQTTMRRQPDNFAAYQARLEAELMKWRFVDECYHIAI